MAAIPWGFCAMGMALMDPCAQRPTAGPLNGYFCKPGGVSLETEDQYIGGERVRVESGCDADCGAFTTDRCWDNMTGTLTTCQLPLAVEAQFTGRSARVVGAVTIGLGGKPVCSDPWVWLEVVEALKYASCVTGSPLARLHIFPAVRIGDQFSGMSKQVRQQRFQVLEAKRISPPAGYTGAFGLVPATFFTGTAAMTDHHFTVDLATMPVIGDCEVLRAVA
ncbi:MAG: hypothetical protein ACRCW4_14125 [Candidatus Neomicrothrix subdominans]